MKKKRFSKEQIIAVLKEAEAARRCWICREHGISDATFFTWKAKYAGMTVAELRRLRELEAGGLPRSITVDHGPGFEGQALDAWAYKRAVRLAFHSSKKADRERLRELQRSVSR